MQYFTIEIDQIPNDRRRYRNRFVKLRYKWTNIISIVLKWANIDLVCNLNVRAKYHIKRLYIRYPPAIYQLIWNQKFNYLNMKIILLMSYFKDAN